MYGVYGNMERYNRPEMQLRNYAFFATLKLDSQTRELLLEKRIILASPIYVAYAD